ncbi:MAG: hypothetical protein ACU85V_20890, partial [Gammaproteobacteria bacterium]
MSQSKQMLAGLLALGVSSSLPFLANAGESTDMPFRIMNAGEIATHTAAMKALEGAAREDYRNAQYAQLKERAARNGYRLPDAPPWANAAGAESGESTDAVARPPDASMAEARHAELREKLEASRAAAERAAEANLQQFKPAESAEVVESEAAPEPVASDQAAAASTTTGAIAPSPPVMAQAPETPPVPPQTVIPEREAGVPPASPSAVAPMPAERSLAGYGGYTAPTPPAPPKAPERALPGSTQAPPAEPPRFMPPEVAAEAQAIAPTEPATVAAGAGERVPPAEPAAPAAVPAPREAAPTPVLPT